MSDMEEAVQLLKKQPEKNIRIIVELLRAMSVPDETEDDPFYSPENMERLKKAAARMDAGGGTVHDPIGEQADD